MRDGEDESFTLQSRGQVPPAPGPIGCCSTSELILLVLLQCFHVPYSALTMFISREQSERDSATAYRKCLLPSFSVPCRSSVTKPWPLSLPQFPH